MDLIDILHAAADAGASDAHVVAGLPPALRVRTLMRFLDAPALSAAETRAMLESIAAPDALRRFEEQRDADFSIDAARLGARASGLGRFRVNAHVQDGAAALALRSIPTEPPALATLGLPDLIERLTSLPRGLVLVTGHTGSGKSTTLAAMIEHINLRDRKHIITLEDPVEFRFTSRRCVVQQRELGRDIPTFASGLRHALRQDPDIILVGELRDLETARLAITAAETGHLVFGTLHTMNAARTVDRIVDMHPGEEQRHVRSMLADTLQAVVSQTLFRRADDTGMAAAVETLVCTPAVRNVIREGRTFEIMNIIETNKALGMRSMDAAISELFLRGVITREDALARASAPERLERSLAA